MPIPVYEQRTNAPRNLNLATRQADPNALGALGDGLQDLAGGIAQGQAFARQKEEEKAAVFANESLMSSRAKWIEELPKRQAAAAESGEGFAIGVLADFDSDASERIQSAPTEASRQYLKQRLSETRLALQQDSLQFEARRSVEYKASGLDRSLNSARTSVEFSPQTFATVLAEQRAAIEASGLPADLQTKFRQSSQDALASASVQGAIRRDPYKALRELNNQKSEDLAFQALDPDDRLQLRNKAEAEVNRIESERRSRSALLQQELSIQMQDARAAAALGIPVAIPDKNQLVAAFGPVRGEAYFKNLLGVQQFSTEVGKLNQLSNSQLEQLASSYEPTQQTGAADQVQLSNALNQRIGQIIEQRKRDPVAYLQGISPSVGDALAKATANEPGSGQALFNAVEAEKDRLGIYSPNVFPKGIVPGSDEFQQTALLAANKYRTLPPEAAIYATNALKSDDPALVAKAAQLLDAANNIAPASYTSVPPELRAKAELVSRMVNSGAVLERAVQTAVDAIKVTPQVAEQRRTVYKEQRKGNVSKLNRYIDDTFDAGIAGFFSSQPAATAQLQGDFEGQVSAYFSQTGDIDVARDLAWQDLQRVYGPSEINGSKQMTAFPLERFTVTPEEVRKEIGELLTVNPQSDQSTAEEITIVADSDTLRVVSDALTGARVRPSYRMVTKSGDLVRDKDGLPLRYFIPSDEQILERFTQEQRKREAQVSQGVEGARRDRAVRIQMDKLRGDRASARFAVPPSVP